jgi:DNA-directed RNA polymerase subunit beta
VFRSVFPITDYNENASLEFVGYHFGEPKYTVEECHDRGMTFAIPLKVTLRLVVYEQDKERRSRTVKDIKEQEVYLGELPLMTEKGTFIINGTERVVVSQLQRSAGVFFDDDKGKTLASGKKIYSARIIPYRGSWVEFEFDANDILHVRIDRRRKMLVTAFLRAFWFLEKNGVLSDEDILGSFYDLEEVVGFEDGTVLVKLNPEIHRGSSPDSATRVAEDIKPPRHREVVVQAGKRLTAKIVERLEELGIERIPVKPEHLEGRRTAGRVVDRETGEVLLEPNQELTSTVLSELAAKRVAPFKVVWVDPAKNDASIYETLARDAHRNPDEALVEMYRRLRPGDPPTVESARALFRGMFLDARRYDLARVGRFMLNKKLAMESPLAWKTLRSEDIVQVIRRLLAVKQEKYPTDDIDHLGNRRVRSVGELLENQFRVGLTRMERAVKERMSIADIENLMPHDLVNAKPVSAVVKEFFGSSQLSQFMDQTNPLAELTHKRRLSALGPRGLSRERAGFEVRDVHPTHYGRICPIETPEGPNIGLISSLSTYARINEFGFIETPYRRVDEGAVSDDIIFLTALEEEQVTIAQANAQVDKRGRFVAERVSARKAGEFKLVPPTDVQYMDVSPKQLVSVAASLIPFLENDDANRALMGSNMQRQAVPLLYPEAPLVGTGMEHIVARDSGAVVLARRAGVVESVSADRIVVRAESRGRKADPVQDLPLDIYNLKPNKYRRSNQNTCINQKPIVQKGQRIAVGDVIADGPGTDQGELALGRNVLVAFMPWGGYNFEDAILVSERLVKDDRYTSIHIEEFEIQARDTKLGKEEITRDIPNVSEEALKDLDESGIVRIGAKVKAGDILVGKITPKGETQLTPEEKLLRAIFGEKAGDVRDTSLTVPPGIEGTVVDVKVFSRRGIDKDERAKSIEEEEVRDRQKDYQDELAIIEMERDQKLKNLLVGKTLVTDLVDGRKQGLGKKGQRIERAWLDEFSWDELTRVKVKEDEGLASNIRKIDEKADEDREILKTIHDEKIARLQRGDDLPPGVIKMVKVYVAVKRKLSVGDKMAGRHGNKGVVSRILPEEDMPYLPDGSPVEIVLNPLGVPSRMNVGQILETHLGWAARSMGVWISSPVFDGATEEEIKEHLRQAKLPTSGKTVLYDGRTGKPFHQEVTVGQIYILKLAHLVDDKMHARSIGPYSLVTQQPLGGKAQFGGQRFGEMEVWALEAYGAAHTLQEMLTVKSDDVEGRNRIYEAIVKGENFLEPGTPESFNVLVKELQSLALDVELTQRDGKGKA